MVNTAQAVLIVDDSQTMTSIMSKIVRQLGYQKTDVAHSAKDALAKMRSASFGLIICELEMQPMTGFELAAVVRKDARLKDIIFILTTASKDSLGHALDDFWHGLVDGYLLKPFTAQQLLSRLNSRHPRRLRNAVR
jgi:two-component system chemotaxis response regulator CheY